MNRGFQPTQLKKPNKPNEPLRHIHILTSTFKCALLSHSKHTYHQQLATAQSPTIMHQLLQQIAQLSAAQPNRTETAGRQRNRCVMRDGRHTLQWPSELELRICPTLVASRGKIARQRLQNLGQAASGATRILTARKNGYRRNLSHISRARRRHLGVGPADAAGDSRSSPGGCTAGRESSWRADQ